MLLEEVRSVGEHGNRQIKATKNALGNRRKKISALTSHAEKKRAYRILKKDYDKADRLIDTHIARLEAMETIITPIWEKVVRAKDTAGRSDNLLFFVYLFGLFARPLVFGAFLSSAIAIDLLTPLLEVKPDRTSSIETHLMIVILLFGIQFFLVDKYMSKLIDRTRWKLLEIELRWLRAGIIENQSILEEIDNLTTSNIYIASKLGECATTSKAV